jgi:beta-glucosidase
MHQVISGPIPQISVEDFLFVPKKLERTTQVYMEAGRPYSICLVVHSRNDRLDVPLHAAKICFEEAFSDRLAIAEAVDLASKSDISIIFGGRTHEHESEGFDLDTIRLPENQCRMIKAVASVSEQTILILHGGNPIDVSVFLTMSMLF